MIRDDHNVIPVSMAVLLHVLLLGSMVIAFDFARTAPITPLAIRATLVTEIPEVAPPRVVEPEPEPEPDNSEELRRAAEEEKRRLDALIEKERLEKIREQEEADRKQKEKEEADRKPREKDEADRKRREEEEKERKRVEAEKKREEDIRRQREENERLRKELEAEARAEEIEAEENRMAAVESGALAVYMAQIRQKIERNWSAPASAGAELAYPLTVGLPGPAR